MFFLFIGEEFAFVTPHYQHVIFRIEDSLQKTSRRLDLRLRRLTFVCNSRNIAENVLILYLFVILNAVKNLNIHSNHL